MSEKNDISGDAAEPLALRRMETAARAAGAALVSDFGRIDALDIRKKGPADFVSQADTRAEAMIISTLSEAYPDWAFLAEESGRSAHTASNCWIIDPLDGTTNFLHGVPHFAVSIALACDHELMAGVVYDPIREEMFAAQRGRGSFLNGQPLRVSARESLSDCLFATGIPFKGCAGMSQFNTRLADTAMACSGTRRFGSAALDCAWVAAGRYDAYWEDVVNIWDVAAGAIIVREAGGCVTTIESNDFDTSQSQLSILASNGRVHDRLAALLRGS